MANDWGEEGKCVLSGKVSLSRKENQTRLYTAIKVESSKKDWGRTEKVQRSLNTAKDL